MKTLSEIQVEQRAWSLKNFGEHPSWHPLLGIQEELGELSDAYLGKKPDAMMDAVADLVIYLMDFCSCEDIELKTSGRVYSGQAKATPQISLLEMQVRCGNISHSYLKREQGIRGTSQQHKEAIQMNVEVLMDCLRVFCDDTDIHLEAATHVTWLHVSTRDWTKNKEDGS